MSKKDEIRWRDLSGAAKVNIIISALILFLAPYLIFMFPGIFLIFSGHITSGCILTISGGLFVSYLFFAEGVDDTSAW